MKEYFNDKALLSLIISLAVWFVIWTLVDHYFHFRGSNPGAMGWLLQIVCTWVPWRTVRFYCIG
jgi:hypothetical protein